MYRANGDKCGVDVLGGNCIACLAHLAILYEVVGRTSPDEEAEAYGLCDLALQKLGTLTSELRFDEYTYLDLLVGVRPFLRCFPTMMTQTRDYRRILGENLCWSLMSVSRTSPLKLAGRCSVLGRPSRKSTPIFMTDSPIMNRRSYTPWLRWRTVLRKNQSIQT